MARNLPCEREVVPCCDLSSDIRGGFSRGVPPLPIPNRAVKPARADGTDTPVGRVGRRRTSGSPGIITMPGLLFFAHMSHTPVVPSTGLCTPRRREGTNVSQTCHVVLSHITNLTFLFPNCTAEPSFVYQSHCCVCFVPYKTLYGT